MFWEDTSKTKNESSDTDSSIDTVLSPEVSAKNAKPIFTAARASGCKGWATYAPFFTMVPPPIKPSVVTSDDITANTTMTANAVCINEIFGFWCGQFRLAQGKSSTPLSLTQLNIELDEKEPDGTKLKGYAVTFSGTSALSGRRRWGKVDAYGEGGGKGITERRSGVEEIDILMYFDDGYSVRLIGKMVKEDDTLVGRWTGFSTKENAEKAYDGFPFGDDLSPMASEGEEGSDGTGGRKSDEGDRREEAEKIEEETSGENGVGKVAQGSGEEETDVPGEENAPGVDAKEGYAEAEGGTKPAKEEDHVDAPCVRTFAFHRTPAEIYQFRDLLFESEEKAKARWKFLRESVLFLVRRHLWSWRNIKVWGENRRKFLDFHKRSWLERCNFKTPNPLTSEDKSAWSRLKYSLPPSYIWLCVEALRWSLSRLPFH